MTVPSSREADPAADGRPLVSVVVPVFNCERYVGAAIEAALAQSHRPLEIIAVDDGSTDRSAEVLRSFVPLITVISQPNEGVSAARNAGIRASKGRYVAFLDADDVWRPDKLARQVSLLERHPSAVACYVDHDVIDADGATQSPTAALFGPRCSGVITKALLEFTVIVTPSLVMARRSALDRAGLFRQGFRNAEDLNMWLRLSVLGPILYDVATLASYRRHGSNNYKGMNADAAMCTLAAVQDFEQSLPYDVDARTRQLAAAAVTRKMLDTAHGMAIERRFGEAWQWYARTLRRQPSAAAFKGLVSAGRGWMAEMLHRGSVDAPRPS